MGKKPKAPKTPYMGEKSQIEMQTNPALEGETPQLEMQPNSGSLSSSRKKAKKQTVFVRRSGRLQSAFQYARRNDVEPVIEEIDIRESEKEDEPRVYEQENSPEPNQMKRSLEEKLDAVLEAQKETRKALKSKGPKISLTSQGPCQTDVQYRSLYFESQKKIETITDENFQLTKKLANALGKLEVYEKGGHQFSEMLEKLKDVILISNMTKATEAAINLSSRAILGGVTSSRAVIGAKTLPAKRKKPAQNGKKPAQNGKVN